MIVRRRLTILALGVVLAPWETSWAGTKEAAAHNDAATVLFNQGKINEAIVELSKAVGEDPAYVPARVNLAYAYERLNRLDEAIDEYRAAIALDPENFLARNNLGVLLDKKGQYDAAIAEFERALKSRPGDAMTRKNLETTNKNKAIFQERQGQIERAERDAQAKPQDAGASYHAARVNAVAGNKAPALQWLERALRLGYKVAEIKSDPAFASLRGDRDFELLLLGK